MTFISYYNDCRYTNSRDSPFIWYPIVTLSYPYKSNVIAKTSVFYLEWLLFFYLSSELELDYLHRVNFCLKNIYNSISYYNKISIIVFPFYSRIKIINLIYQLGSLIKLHCYSYYRARTYNNGLKAAIRKCLNSP